MPENRRFLLRRRPDGTPVPDDFELVTEPTRALAEGQFLVRNHYGSTRSRTIPSASQAGSRSRLTPRWCRA